MAHVLSTEGVCMSLRDPPPLPDFADVVAAAARIAGHAQVTPVLHSQGLDALSGARIVFKCEQLQRGGAFKFRGACNAVLSLDDAAAAGGVVTHSSGNHGAALALAAGVRGIACHVVVPEGAVASKLAAIQAYGAQLHRCEATMAAREATCRRVQQQTGAVLIHPYADARVIAGQGTAALELLGQCRELDAVVVPIGGGGLAAGTAIAAAALAPGVPVYAAEPAGAADAAASLASGRVRGDIAPRTLCDGLRATVGEPNLALLQRHGVQVLLVEDACTVQAMRLFAQRCKQLIEPSSAIALATVLAHPQHFAGRRVGMILSGGNVDLDAPMPWNAVQSTP